MSDLEHLEWLFSRMVEVHGDSPNTDYLLRFRKIIESLDTVTISRDVAESAAMVLRVEGFYAEAKEIDDAL